MQFEKITDSKFELFKGTIVAFPHAVFGGGDGLTSTPNGQSDEMKDTGEIDTTEIGSRYASDGYIEQ